MTTQRLVLEVTPEQRRQVKTLAAFSGMSMKDFILARALASDEPETKAARTRKGKPAGRDETEYLMASPAMVKHVREALKEPPNKRRSFRTLKELKHALGV